MIPEIVHHIVGPKTNQIVDRCLSSWTILREVGYEIVTWNDQDIEVFLKENYHFALPGFLHARNHAEAADIARYLIIYHYGGHYMDWDVELLEPNKFLRIAHKNPDGYFIVDPANGTLASEVFASSPKCEYLLQLSYEIARLYNSGEIHALGTPQYSGPYRMRDFLEIFGTISQPLIPVKKMFAFDYSEIRNRPKKKVTQPLIHYWIHSWIKQSANKDKGVKF
ncbi:MAG: hypothetical protein EOO20_15120 [Chryseobacterium sp.]|nr:MAG: hypothetical protein EOO20_15120 [Chryseobacterium sp.]